MNEFINKFPLTQEIRNIFEQSIIEDKNEIIKILEEYLFLDRDTILGVLNPTNDYPFVDAPNNNALQKYSENTLFCIQGNSATVYIHGFDTINTNKIELHLSKYDVTFVRLTPANFNQLSIDNYEPLFDPLILFKRILIEALNRHATDIHFDTKHYGISPRYTVMFRIDSELFPYTDFKINERLNREMISKLVENKTSVTSLDLISPDGITAEAKDVLGTGIAELRISANKCLDGFHYVIRIQKRDTVSLTIDQLGFHSKIVEDLMYVTRRRSGITLITGAVRTGKNTTAFAIENEMTKLPIKLVSYEYPVEVLMPVSQVDYANDEHVLLNAIRLAKKQDVNVAFLNEIPNKEVAFAVQDLVNSSIHVITTMHLDRLWLLPYRLKEYYGTSYRDVLSQINAIFNQKMFSVPCPHCQRKIMIDDIQDKRKTDLLRSKGVRFAFESYGCDKCAGLGHVIGKNQPYAEHIVFNNELVSALLRCEEPYQMEIVLHNEVDKNKTALEDYMTMAISEGKLSVEALDSIV